MAGCVQGKCAYCLWEIKIEFAWDEIIYEKSNNNESQDVNYYAYFPHLVKDKSYCNSGGFCLPQK